MILGIISDTHDNLPKVREAMGTFAGRGVDRLIHCGDFIAPFVVKIIGEAGYKDCIGVYGNNDGEWLWMSKLFGAVGKIYKPPVFVDDVCGLRVAVLHEPMPDDVMAALPVDLVAFGHTHETVIRPGRPLVVNPGECCGYLSGSATVAVVDTEKMEAELIELP